MMDVSEAEGVPLKAEMYSSAEHTDASSISLLDEVIDNGEVKDSVDKLCIPIHDKFQDTGEVARRLDEFFPRSPKNQIPIFDEAELNGNDGFSDEKSSVENGIHYEEKGLSSENTCSSPFHDESSRASLSSENEICVDKSESDINDTLTEELPSAVTNNVSNRTSMLHCYICGRYYTEPKLLNCLHTFCLECLEHLIFYKEHQKIECVVCGQRTQIPHEGIPGLPTNVIFKNILTYKTNKKNSHCDICALHGLENEVAGQCIDCNDMLCTECCEKHTFSRQTVNHTVLSLEAISDKEQGFTKLRETVSLNCTQHKDEKLKFYCVACKIVVCRDCVLVSHNLHQVLTSDKVIQNIKDEIENKIDQLNVSQMSKSEELEKYEEALKDEEKRQKKTLETAFEEVKASIEEKYKLCFDDLSAQYKYLSERCKQRKQNIEKTKIFIEELKTNIKYILDQGLDSELADLQTVIKKQLSKLQNTWNNLRPTVDPNQPLPSVDIYGDNCMTLKKMSLFKTVRTRNIKSGTRINPNNKSEKNLTIGLGNLGLDKKPKVSMKPAGMRQDIVSNNEHDVPIQTSLLGEYYPKTAACSSNSCQFTMQLPRGPVSVPGNLPQNLPNSATGQSYKHQLSDCGLRNTRTVANAQQKHQSAIVPKTMGQHGESLVLKTTLSVKVLQDDVEPCIAGMTFLGQHDFAVSDVKNRKVKIFSSCGKFLYVIGDYEPMTLTFCSGHLVWNAMTRKVLTRATGSGIQRIHKKRFQPDVSHPVSTFEDDKYLVANVQGKIAAFRVDGTLVSETPMRDSSGDVMKGIHCLAARRSGHLAAIDSTQQKVVITDLNGRCKGEFHGNCDERNQSEWKAGCVCMDEMGNLFVSDLSRNRVLLLSPTGDLIKEWITLIDNPNSIACNGAGILLVAGSNKSVNVYNYSYGWKSR